VWQLSVSNTTYNEDKFNIHWYQFKHFPLFVNFHHCTTCHQRSSLARGLSHHVIPR
jgi:hypothetical protein